jgi:hypothetical protein
MRSLLQKVRQKDYKFLGYLWYSLSFNSSSGTGSPTPSHNLRSKPRCSKVELFPGNPFCSLCSATLVACPRYIKVLMTGLQVLTSEDPNTDRDVCSGNATAQIMINEVLVVAILDPRWIEYARLMTAGISWIEEFAHFE